jgi:hypothetical protein
MKTNKKLDYLTEVRESLYLKAKQIDSRQEELLNVLNSINPNNKGDISDYYFISFASLITNLNSNEYFFEEALVIFNILIEREVGPNKKYWDCANSLRKCTLHGEEFFNSLKSYSIVYPMEGMYVQELETQYELEKHENNVKRSTR